MGVDNELIKKLKVCRVKCDNDLLFFTRYFYKRLRNQKFITNWHHDDICQHLHKVQNYELEYLGINIPPRFSKTELAAVNFISRGIGMNPSSNWLYITASDELRSETSTRIRDIVSDEHFKLMYGVELKKDQNAKNLWRTTQGGGLKTATIFGQITGFGAGQMVDADLLEYIRNFEGCIVLDDVNKTDDSEALTAVNSKVTRVIGNTILSRKNSPDTPIINIQQRAGIEDATAYFLELYKDNPKAINLVYPIIYKDKSLWPWKMPMNKIMELAKSPKTSHVFQTQYMQDPQPSEGLIINPKNCNYYDELNDIDGVKIGYIDTADDGTDNTAFPSVKVVNGKVYLTDALFSKSNLTVLEPLILARLEQNELDSTYIETNSAGRLFMSNIIKGTKLPIKPIRNNKNKIQRMAAQAGFIEQNFYFPKNPESLEMINFLKEAFRVTKEGGSNQKDDALDSLAGLSYVLRVIYPQLFK
jgi:predicted phage terminase large subunit-like protein